MALENLTVSRVCLHEVYVRDDAGNVVQPQYAQGLFQLQGAALNAFRSRVLAAFKSDGHCMEMAIRDSGAGSAVAIGAELLNGANDADFILQSRHFADKLAASQTSQRIPGGVVVVFEGSVGQPANRFFAVMKAELHEAFQKTGNLQARFVSDLFLSKGTKLYKIGLFMDEGAADDADFPDGWSPLLFDQLRTASRRDGAANYFYSNFLGLDIPEDSAHRVKQFFEQTKSYIRSSNLPRDQKVDLFNGLYTYLKVDQSPTIQVQQFADNYLPNDVADNYVAFMRGQGFPARAVDKDLREVQGNLKLRHVRFGNKVTLSGPPQAFAEMVTMETVEADGGIVTRITIKGEIENPE